MHVAIPWNTIIRKLSLSPTPTHALHLFVQMLRSTPSRPDTFTYASAFKACGRARAHFSARTIHALTVKTNTLSNAFVANTALHTYASCGDIASARKLFSLFFSPDVVAWNAMLSGYVQNDLLDDALKLFDRMWSAGVAPTAVTVISVLSACGGAKDFSLGRQVHGFVKKSVMQLERELFVGTCLIDMYAKCGCLEFSLKVFDEMRIKDVGVWNALIGGHVHNGCFSDVLRIFQDLEMSGLIPDELTIVCVLSACANLGELEMGKKIHLYIKERFLDVNAKIGTALIDMYSKCGCIAKSKEVFDMMHEKDATAWTSMIGGLAIHGQTEDALQLFSLMQRYGVRPDGVTFVGVLCACSHAGLVEQGLHYFQSMIKDYSIVPRIEHYGCMIDLFGRAGRLKESLEFIYSMDVQANAVVWRALLSACRVNLDVELAEVAVRNLLELGTHHCGDYVLLANIYASKGMWDDAWRIRKLMEGWIQKNPGFSLIELHN
ncbi:TPR-like protein [Dioscorea alata]|uniref:TPR-like protein n=1 Tax=Dioscorea alata TaxID=55571 RepID=A0ACB7W7P6_DIOAL|nr:TPR-like protein [Dioscorea alata]